LNRAGGGKDVGMGRRREGSVTVRGPDLTGVLVEQVAYSYSLRGRLAEAVVDATDTGGGVTATAFRPDGAAGCSHGWSDAASGVAEPVEVEV
jgi:hypothetical protein